MIRVEDVTGVEFGVCADNGNDRQYFLLPVGREVQGALQEMLSATQDQWRSCDNNEQNYNPAQKYGTRERLSPRNYEELQEISNLYHAENIVRSRDAIDDPYSIYYYFAIFIIANDNNIIAVRKAGFFKGLLSKKLIWVVNESLKLVDKPMFKLDNDFDFVIFPQKIMIFRPKSFEAIAGLDKVVLTKVPENVKIVRRKVKFLNLNRIKDYASTRKKAARLLSSIAARDDLHLLSFDLLKSTCGDCNVQIDEKNGQIGPAEANEIAFLNILDRRRYGMCLIEDQSEVYEAPNRRSVT